MRQSKKLTSGQRFWNWCKVNGVDWLAEVSRLIEGKLAECVEENGCLIFPHARVRRPQVETGMRPDGLRTHESLQRAIASRDMGRPLHRSEYVITTCGRVDCVRHIKVTDHRGAFWRDGPPKPRMRLPKPEDHSSWITR
jgi:hypothetical protein